MCALFLLLFLYFFSSSSAFIESDRVMLRSWNNEDLDALYTIVQDAEVNEYLKIHGLHIRDNLEKLIKNANESIIQKQYGYFACEDRDTKELIGFAGLNCTDINKELFPRFTISYLLARKYWQKGYATEIGKALLKYAFEEMGLSQVGACTVAINHRSIQVMNRLHMHYISMFDFKGISTNHPHCKHVFYAISKEEYRENLTREMQDN